MIGSHIVQSVVGAPQASRVAAREKRRQVEEREDARGRDEDVVDVPVAPVEESAPARRVGRGGDEDAHEDRQESGIYAPGPGDRPRKGGSIDLSA